MCAQGYCSSLANSGGEAERGSVTTDYTLSGSNKSVRLTNAKTLWMMLDYCCLVSPESSTCATWRTERRDISSDVDSSVPPVLTHTSKDTPGCDSLLSLSAAATSVLPRWDQITAAACLLPPACLLFTYNNSLSCHRGPPPKTPRATTQQCLSCQNGRTCCSKTRSSSSPPPRHHHLLSHC